MPVRGQCQTVPGYHKTYLQRLGQVNVAAILFHRRTKQDNGIGHACHGTGSKAEVHQLYLIICWFLRTPGFLKMGCS